MQTVSINRLHARYYLAPGADDQHERLDQIRQQVFDTELERALDTENISPRDIVCIRRLDVAVRLCLTDSDETLQAAWSADLSRALQDVFRDKSFDRFVRYDSRAAALVDFFASVAERNYRRSWVWRQLGFLERTELQSHQQAIEAILRVCRDEPGQILPVLSTLASRDLLTRFASVLPTNAWSHLAGLSLSNARGSADVLEQLQRIPPELQLGRDLPLAQAAARRLDRSRIASAVAQHPGIARSQPDRIGLTVLSLLEADPGFSLLPANLLRQSIAVAARLIVDTMLCAQLTSQILPQELRSLLEDGASESDRAQPPDSEPDRWTQSATAPGEPASSVQSRPTAALEGMQPTPHGEPGASEPGLRIPREPGYFLTRTAADRITDEFPERRTAEGSGPRSSDPLRSTGLTRWGGLLFLIGIVDELELPDQMVASRLYPDRSLPWLLHRTALQLIPLEDDDPAALAFCGLGPESIPPSGGEPDPTEAELQQIGTWARSVLNGLRGRLDFDGEDAELIEQVCHRRARVVADPGWIEIIMSLDDVATGIRRAGLDLNPEYVPWLGVVLRFIYE